ncbi:MAG TPA: peptidase S16 [Gammaproteobacteria bacterium]|nr:peptidase S16 [Gammaproteobacteria bacterium]
MLATARIPIFPLHTVLFPGGPLPLRIFEARYTDMISQCLKSNIGFGVCLITEGKEVGGIASTHEVGTLASIQDWHMRKDGLLGIVVKGEKRFRVIKQNIEENKLMFAEVEYFEEDATKNNFIPREYDGLVDMLEERMSQVGSRYASMKNNYIDASWVGFRLAELLPLRSSQKQYFLQLNDPIQRLERLGDVLQHIDIST